jgi:hypothetical protein
VVLYWFETWSYTLREGHRVRIFENRVLRRIFGSKMDDVTGSWRKLDNEELHILYFSSSRIRMMKSRKMRWPERVARIWEKRNSYKILVGKREGKKPLRGLRRRLMDNVKMNLRDIGWGGMDWIDMVQDREQWRALVNTVMNVLVRWNIGKFLSSFTTGGFSRKS